MERKTQPVKAEIISDWDEFHDGEGQHKPGAVHLRGNRLWYTCPCGCRAQGALLVGLGFKPEQSPSWTLHWDLLAPSLEPSVHHVGHWHGWLRNGVWISA